MHRYIPNTKNDTNIMLESIGVKSIEDLFQDIPKELRLERALNLASPLAETELIKHMKNLSDKNKSIGELTCFLGAGAYDHYIPSIIKHLAMRSEFFTAYTPYQPEISQGTLQAIFEYQTMICNLTGMDITNASMYDGATATLEAAMMAVENTKRKTLLVSKTVHPEVRKVLHTYMKFRDVKMIEISMAEGVTDLDHLKSVMDTDTAGVILQSPNFFGAIEDLGEAEKIIHQNKAMLIHYADPISLGILKSPGELGADIVVGEGQSLGNPLNFGGPYLGFLATTSKLVRKIPGRIVGQSEDVDGKRAFVLTLQAREQHIRRYKATSNICSNQGLNALIATIYLVTMGKKGLKEVAMQSTQKAHYALKQMTKSGKFKPLFHQPFFKEFAVSSEISSKQVNQELMKHGILGGYALDQEYPELENGLLFCVTEKRTKEEIDKLVEILEVI
ncbi:aminomethyl-transferring glycine dehydrogenase subunit GcvPA [Clostridium formicaceticum]|uniref:Probable glycine dehydrogenase (decarboxylating) subunit 1 n=1 Tax=Clostridium formicaceticum TaxID=1497 RepID=A0AAC9WI75_9CLOT|nr:aminomethyl-transferring glycine dehydrogenase subunit GcvPA [Clostridium formicaceticum]AOY75262.1 glycine dehydrogenase (aminomethyl-transferring) [Clostridium formicaceticum]ARE89698.1 putative glycine dehydrogenase (decarboxylating) subunit 1 [Clostridium formicaceticum]